MLSRVGFPPLSRTFEQTQWFRFNRFYTGLAFPHFLFEQAQKWDHLARQARRRLTSWSQICKCITPKQRLYTEAHFWKKHHLCFGHKWLKKCSESLWASFEPIIAKLGQYFAFSIQKGYQLEMVTNMSKATRTPGVVKRKIPEITVARLCGNTSWSATLLWRSCGKSAIANELKRKILTLVSQSPSKFSIFLSFFQLQKNNIIFSVTKKVSVFYSAPKKSY